MEVDNQHAYHAVEFTQSLNEASWIRTEQTRTMYAHAPLSMLAVSVFSLLLAYALWSVVSHPVLIAWLCAIFIMILLRFILVHQYRRASQESLETDRWGFLFTMGQLLNGVLWGVAGIVLFSEESIAHQLVLIIVIAGLVAGAVGSYSKKSSVIFFFTLPAMTPITLKIFLIGSDVHTLMGVMAVIFTIVMVVTAHRISTVAQSSLSHQYKNLELISSLTAEKKRVEQLNRELETEISERHRAQEAMKSEKSYLEQLYESAQEAIVLMDTEGKIIRVNSEFTQLFGYSIDEAVENSLDDLVVPEEHRDEGLSITNTAARGEKIVRETVRKRKDGTRIHVSVLASPISIDHRVVAVYSIYRDITKQKQAEADLRESEERYRSVMEAAPDPIVVYDMEGRVTYLNSAFTNVFGWDLDEIRGKRIDFVPEENLPETEDAIARLNRGEFIPAMQTKRKTKDGTVLDIQVSASTFKDPEDHPVGIVVILRDVTQNERMAAELRKSEERYRSVLKAAPDPLVVYDMEGKVTYLNPAFTDVFGWTLEESLGKRTEFVPEENRPETLDAIDRMFKGETVQTMETKRLTKDGRLLDIQVSSSTFFDRDGKPEGSIVILRDVTGMVEMSRALKESEARYRNLFEDSIDAIYLTTRNGKFIDANQSTLDLFGYSREEMMALNARDLYSESRDMRRFLKSVEKSGFVRDFEVVLKKKDRTKIDCLFNVSARRSDDGRIEGFQGIIRDITHIKHAEEVIRESEERYRTLFEDSIDAIYTTTRSGKYIDANQSMVDLFGYRREEMMKLNALELFAYPEDVERFRESIEPRGFVRDFEVTLRKKDGSLIEGLFNGRVKRDETGKIIGYHGIIRDITESKQILEELKLAKEAAEAANRAKSQFLTTMSHEIRTPMNAIIGMADVLRDTPLTAEQGKYVDVFASAGENLLNIINDVLDISKVESGQLSLEKSVFHLKDIIKDISDVLTIQAREKGLALTHEISADVPELLIGDAVRLRQILINLIGNAIKFSNAGGVSINVKPHPNSPAKQDKGHVELLFSVTDTGIGISSEKLDLIFDSFTQVDASTTREHGGTGLGLSISKRLVELMGGQIWVDSQLGKGSTFYFTVPYQIQREPPEKSKTTANSPEKEQAELKRIRILLAEDTEDNRLLIKSFLKKTPYQLDIAENGIEAVKLFQSQKYDLVLMDIQMPVMDGYTATKKIRKWEVDQEAKITPILALTAYATNEDAQKSLDAGCTDHLTKPIRKAKLLETIKAYSGMESESPRIS